MLAAAVLLALLAAAMLAWSVLHPPRMNDGKALWLLKRLSPGDLGLTFQPTDFHVRDHRGQTLRLAAWWIPSAAHSERCVLLLHGYADAKVGAIAWAPLLHELGWNVLALDLPAHGESEGRLATAGLFERQPLGHVIDELRAARPMECRRLALFGISYGAAVAALTAAGRDDIAAVVLESPFASFRSALRGHCDMLGLPGRWLQEMALIMARIGSGADLGSVQPAAALEAVRCPVLAIVGGEDPLVDEPDRQRLARAMHARSGSATASQLWLAAGSGHLTAMLDHEAEYRRRVGEFLARCGLE